MDDKVIKYFDDDLSENDRLAIMRDISASDQLKADFMNLQNLIGLACLAEKPSDRIEGKKSYRRFVNRYRKNNGRHKYPVILRLIKYAAAVAILIIGTYLAASKITFRKMNEEFIVQTNSLIVPAGQRACLVLHDGTTVWLNAQSTIIYPSMFGKADRTVHVTGEAYFDVAKDPQRPFIVISDDITTTVLGTKFNLCNYQGENKCLVSLFEGSVKVDVGDKNIVLKPDQEVRIENDEFELSHIENAEMLLWTNGVYSFNNERLEDIICKLQLYYDITIDIQNDTLKSERYTCKFRQRDGVEKILNAIRNVHNFDLEVDESENRITIK